MKPTRIKKLRQFLKRVTPGPWIVSRFGEPIIKEEDLEFMAVARTIIPELLDYIKVLETQLYDKSDSSTSSSHGWTKPRWRE